MKLEKLEAIRGFAALYVVANHVVGWTFLKNVLPAVAKLPFRLGQEAVILFFLLSGFVIYLSESRSKSINFPRYFLKRFVRIYPILIVSLILSIIVAAINHHHFVKEDIRQFIANLFMLQDITSKPGYIALPFLGNSPLWTLSYECGFYLMFYPVYIFFIKEKTISISSTYVVLGISMVNWLLYVLYPNHLFLVLSYFSLWWAGAACAQVYLEYKTFTFKTLKPALLSLTVMTLFTSIPFIRTLIYGGYLHQVMYPIITFRHYGVALLFILIALGWWRINLKGFDALLGVFERLAPISYALYITHYIFILLVIPGINPYVSLLIRLVLAFVTAYLLEIKMQPVINKLLLKKQPK